MKKTIVLISVFMLIISVLNSYSQSKEYDKIDISTYYSPSILRQQLDLTFDLSNTFSSSNHNSVESSQNSFNWDVKPIYNKYKNNRSIVSDLNISGSTVGNLRKVSSANMTNSQSIISTFYAGYDMLLYSKSKYHLILNALASYENEFGRSKSDLSQDGNNFDKNNNFLQLNAGLGFGYGRIENVEDARQAVYILSALTDKNRMARTLNEDEIFDFAKVISSVKNKRHLDSRLRKIEEITAVDSFLVKKSLKSGSDATYFSTLNDMWEYGALANRKSGQILQLSANPGFTSKNEDTYYEFNNNLTVKNENTILSGMVQLKYQYEKPTNLYWQHSIVANIQYTYTDENELHLSSTENKFWKNNVNATGEYTLGYYPNTRTYFTGTISANSMFESSDMEGQSINYIRKNQAILTLQMFYFFSPRLKLSANLALNYYNYEIEFNQSAWNTKYNYLYARAGVKLNYSFF